MTSRGKVDGRLEPIAHVVRLFRVEQVEADLVVEVAGTSQAGRPD